jgi:hypothetical protein
VLGWPCERVLGPDTITCARARSESVTASISSIEGLLSRPELIGMGQAHSSQKFIAANSTWSTKHFEVVWAIGSKRLAGATG